MKSFIALVFVAASLLVVASTFGIDTEAALWAARIGIFLFLTSAAACVWSLFAKQ